MPYSFNPFSGNFDNTPTVPKVAGFYLPLSGGTLTGKLSADANNSASKLNIGNALSGTAPATVQNGDVWITNGNRLSYRSSNVNYNTAQTTQANSFNTYQVIDTPSNTTEPALRITQRGTGNALVVEDETNPDSNPFIINNVGSVGIGLSSLSGIDAKLTVVGNISSTGLLFVSGGNSNNWNSSYSTVQSNSATNWDNSLSNSYTHINFLPLSGGTLTGNLQISGTATLSGNLEVGLGETVLFVDNQAVGIKTETPNKPLTVNGEISANNTIYDGQGNSSQWNSAHTTVNSNSATNWNYQGTDLKGLSSDWQNTFNTVNSNSATNWNYQGTDLKGLSSDWQNTFNTVNSNSATNWDNSLSNAYTHTNFLPLSGGTITESLSVNDVMQVGNGDVVFYVTDDKVGINTDTPNEALTVVGNISATETIIAQASLIPVTTITVSTNKTFNNSDSNKVFHFDTTSQTLSAIFPNSLNSGFNVAVMNIGTNNLNLSASTLINTANTNINAQYGGAYIYKDSNNIFAVNNSSNNLNYQGTDLKGLSSDWQNTFTTVQSKSASEWDNTLSNAYTHLNFLPLSGGTLVGALSTTESVYAQAVFTESIVTTKPILFINDTVSVSALTVTELTSSANDVELFTTTAVTITAFSGGIKGASYTLTNVGTQVITISATPKIFMTNNTSINISSQCSCLLRASQNNIVSIIGL